MISPVLTQPVLPTTTGCDPEQGTNGSEPWKAAGEAVQCEHHVDFLRRDWTTTDSPTVLPTQRPATSPKTAESGAWKHDLYDGPRELVGPARSAVGRGARHRGGDLIDGPQLGAKSSNLADRMRGFGADAERKLAAQQRKEVTELLPQGGSVAGVGGKAAVRTAVRRVVVPPAAPAQAIRPARRRPTERIPGLDDPMETRSTPSASTSTRTLGVKGTADGTTKVIMEGLLKGTSEDDVKVGPNHGILYNLYCGSVEPSSRSPHSVNTSRSTLAPFSLNLPPPTRFPPKYPLRPVPRLSR
jgi:hypothetical protein